VKLALYKSRALVFRAYGKDAGLALDHDVAGIVKRCADKVDVWIVLDPLPDGFSSGARLSKPTACKNKPRYPLAVGDLLIWPAKPAPVMEQGLRLFLQCR
jgi:hypothetical protein